MAKIDEMSIVAKLGILVLVAGLGVAGAYYGLLNPKIDANKQLQAQVKAKKDENDRLRPFETQLPMLNQQLANLQQQLNNQRLIVPDEKEADKFIKLLHDTAASAGIEIRRYTAMPIGRSSVSNQFGTPGSACATTSRALPSASTWAWRPLQLISRSSQAPESNQ